MTMTTSMLIDTKISDNDTNYHGMVVGLVVVVLADSAYSGPPMCHVNTLGGILCAWYISIWRPPNEPIEACFLSPEMEGALVRSQW